MGDLNKTFLVGRLATKVRRREVPVQGKDRPQTVCDFLLAVNRDTRDEKEIADFLDITVWGKRAESCAKYLDKGSKVLVEGRLRSSRWNAADGKSKYKMQVVADRVDFLSPSSNPEKDRLKADEQAEPPPNE